GWVNSPWMTPARAVTLGPGPSEFRPREEIRSLDEEGAMPTWVEAELATADLGDERLNHRFRILLHGMSLKPSLKFPALFNGRAEVNAGYEFLDNPKVEEAKVFAPHRDASVQRIRADPVVIVPQD